MTDGAELCKLAARRTAGADVESGSALALDAAASADDLAAAVAAALRSDREHEIRALIAQLRSAADRAAWHGPDDELARALDRLCAVGAALLHTAPRGAVTKKALESFHRICDAVSQRPPLPGPPAARVYREVLARVRALGALAVRLELWRELRVLADHASPGADGRIYPGWLNFMEVQVRRAIRGSLTPDDHREAQRAAAACAGQLAALRPDHADEHRVLESVLVFDFLSRVVEVDGARRAGRANETYPDFVYFDAERIIRPYTRMLVEGSDLRDELLGHASDNEIAEVLRLLEHWCGRTGVETRFWSGLADQDVEVLILLRAGAPEPHR